MERTILLRRHHRTKIVLLVRLALPSEALLTVSAQKMNVPELHLLESSKNYKKRQLQNLLQLLRLLLTHLALCLQQNLITRRNFAGPTVVCQMRPSLNWQVLVELQHSKQLNGPEQVKMKDARPWVVIRRKRVREGYFQTPMQSNFLLTMTVSMKAW